MANTHGFDVVIQGSEAVARKALRGAWKSAECPGPPDDQGRIPEFLDVPVPIELGGYEIVDGHVEIPQGELDATLAPDINSVELAFGLKVQLQVGDPPVPSAEDLDFDAEVRVRAPMGTIGDTQDVGIILDGLPRSRTSATLTSGHPLQPRIDQLLAEFVHVAYENGGQDPPVEPFLPHVLTREDQSLSGIGTADIHAELFDDETDDLRQIEVSRPDPGTVRISIPLYVRIHDINLPNPLLLLLPDGLEDPMGIETRLVISAPFEDLPGLYRARLNEATVTLETIDDPETEDSEEITPVSATVTGSTLEGDNYETNKARLAGLFFPVDLDALIRGQLISEGTAIANGFNSGNPVEIEVPTTAEIEEVIGDIFHDELTGRGSIALWSPTASDDEFEVDDVEVEVIAEAFIIAINAGAGADVTAITGFIPAGREFAIALNGETVDEQLDQALEENGFDDLPVRFREDGKDVDLTSLTLTLVPGAIRMTGEVTVIDAILGSIDVDASFRVDVGLHWVPDGAQNSEGFQELEHHIISEDVDPDTSVGWIIAIILAIITFGAGAILLSIVIIVVALIIQSIASNIGSEMLTDGVTDAVEGITAWPPELSRIGRVIALFHDNVAPIPSGILIDPTGLVLEGTMEVVSDCEDTTVMAARTAGSYTTDAASPLALQAVRTHPDAAYRWVAGDGSAEAAVQNTSHVYVASGRYLVKHGLTIQQPGGASSRHFGVVHVRDVPPEVNVGPDITVNEGEVVTLVGRFTDVEPGDTHESMWNFGDHQPPEAGVIDEASDGTRVEGTSTVTHAWCDNGDYTVHLRVRDQNGGVGTDTLQVRVLNVPPVVEAGPDLFAYPCTVLTVTGRFEDPGWCDTHRGWWTFGDCTPDQTAIVEEVNEAPAARGVVVASHVYNQCGTFHAVCTVEDDDGGVGQDYTVVRVVDVRNAGFEDGFRRQRLGEVANAWHAYAASGAPTATTTGAASGARARFSCEPCVVRGGQRAQGIRPGRGGTAGIFQSIGANPGWAYHVTAWYSVAEGSGGTARLGVDPSGGTDPAASGVVWSPAGASNVWAQLVQRVIATGTAITIFLETDGAAAPEAEVGFDDVALVPVQPFCPDAPPEEEPEDRCVDFTDLQPDTELPPVYDKEGFTFAAMDKQPHRIVGWGPPDGRSKLEIRRGVLVALPFAASYVRVRIGLNTTAPVVVLAVDASGEVVDRAQTEPEASGTLVPRVLTGEGIVRLQISSRGGEDTLYEVCARRGRGGLQGPGRLTATTERPSAEVDPAAGLSAAVGVRGARGLQAARGASGGGSSRGAASGGSAGRGGPSAGSTSTPSAMIDPTNLDDVRAVFGRHRDALIETYNASGAGIGRDGDDYVIVVYVGAGRRKAPEAVEGVPVKLQRSGPFSIQST